MRLRLRSFMKDNRKIVIPVLLALLAALTLVYSRFFGTGDRIYVTDGIYVAPRTEPLQYLLLVFAGVGLLLLGFCLGVRLVLFLFRKGIIFQTVGVLLLIVAAGLSFRLVTGDGVGSAADYVAGAVLVLFTGTFGVLMTLANRIGRRGKNR